MKTRRTIAVLLAVGMLLGLANGKAAQANVIQNPGCLFTGGGSYTNNPANMPNWDTSVGAPFFSNPQGIFNYTTEYMQVQTTATQDLYQHVTVGSSGAALLSMQGMHRNDNVFPVGTVFADVYAGTLTSFGSATPITPSSSVWPSLSGSIQTFSHTYNSLAAGNYTVRMGGTYSSGGLFQAGMDNISLTVGPPGPPPPPVTSRLGTWSYEGYGGAIGFLSGLFTERATQLGLHLRGESVIDSFTIDQVEAAGRHRIKDITVYASPTESYSFQLTDSQAPQTFALPDVQTSSLLMTVDSRYTAGSNDFNMGISALTLTGVEIAPDVNLNAGILPTTVGALGGWDYPARATDGTVHDGGTSPGSTDTATYFTRNAGQDSLTVNYGQPTSINMIGLGVDPQSMAGAGAGGMRDIPRFITLEYDGGSQQVDLWGDRFQYARYSLSTPITDTSFLRIVFPDGGSAGDWYIHQDANYGITEFQAFHVQAGEIPEPATMAMLGLALTGLGGYVRRRRRGRC